MDRTDLNFAPHSDAGAKEIKTINEHKNLIKNNQYSDATALLDNNDYQLGVRASLLNSIQNKIRMVELYFLNEFVAEKDEYFSIEEPEINFMKENGYSHWIKPW